MIDERMRRVGQNEALYRQVNERIDELHEAWGADGNEFAVVCECGDLECADQITLTRTVYEHARADATHFIVKPGHVVPDLERVIERHDDFDVIEKLPPGPSSLAEATDPRS